MQSANSAADTGDAVSNAVVNPEASLFIREILEKALTNPVGVAPRWLADGWALLANVLMNDYLNWWNDAGPEELKKADNAVQNALALNSELALAHHAKGLIYRARRQPDLARKAFRKAKQLDSGFARAHAQFGNQKAALAREDEVQDPLDKATGLSPRHPASGYFYWGKGRAYFQQQDWPNAIDLLKKSVEALPTVWYNRCYLATAQNSAGDAANKAAAQQTMRDFINDPRFDQATLRRIVPSLQPDPNDPPTVAATRKTVRDFVQPLLP
jgi:tetratricopeptide (TPR) repeat protein